MPDVFRPASARWASASEIAQAVGYETDSAFVKAFKRHVGETPGAYRRSLGKREAGSTSTPG